MKEENTQGKKQDDEYSIWSFLEREYERTQKVQYFILALPEDSGINPK